MERNYFSLICSFFCLFFLTIYSIGSYIPGMAFFLGFSQQNEDNPQKEVSASVVVTSADSIDVKIELPEVEREPASEPSPRSASARTGLGDLLLLFVFFQYTLSRQAIPSPLLAASVHTVTNVTAEYSVPGDAWICVS